MTQHKDTYRTLAESSEGLFKSKGSKFIAFAYPVVTNDEIKQILDDLKKKYHDARHHCYAYYLGYSCEYYRANDDGEPSNSAGKPILGQLQSWDLTNTLVVVIRYFGGVLLGVGGLINAYKSASNDALSHAKVITRKIQDHVHVHFAYEDMSPVMRILKDDEITIRDQQFLESCHIDFEIRKKRTPEFIERLESLKTTRVEVNQKEQSPQGGYK